MSKTQRNTWNQATHGGTQLLIVGPVLVLRHNCSYVIDALDAWMPVNLKLNADIFDIQVQRLALMLYFGNFEAF